MRHLPDTDSEPPEHESVPHLVQNYIDRERSVYSPQFAFSIEKCGDQFVEEYLDEVATHMGYRIVGAFESHDLKDYVQTAERFGDVYMFLFPVDRSTAMLAGGGYAYALESHDVIEDGFNVVKRNHAPVTEYEGVKLDGGPLTGSDIRNDRGWENVYAGFSYVSDALDLPESYVHKGEQLQSYPFHQTEFFRHHTIANEASDDSVLVRASQKDMMNHARKAQIIKFSALVSDEDILDWIADEYLDAVKAHDAHTMDKQWENVERMTSVYRTVLDTVIRDEYDENA